MHKEIVEARQQLGLSQARFAKISGIPRSQLRRLEEGLSVTTTTLAKALRHLPNLHQVHFYGVEIVSDDHRTNARQALTDMVASAQGIIDAANRLLAMIPDAHAAGPDEITPELEDEIRELDADVDALREAGRRSH